MGKVLPEGFMTTLANADRQPSNGESIPLVAAKQPSADVEPTASDGDALHALGLEAISAGRSVEALELLSRAAEVNPTNVGYLISIGRLLTAETMLNQAALAYLRAQELAPRDPVVLSELAGVLKRLNKNQEAGLVLRQAAELPTSRDPATP
jgi:Flp pilus assembly protein TadD